MAHLLQPLLHFLFRIGYFGPLLMGIMDSSFLFLPFGNDLLVVASVARHHQGFLLYVLAAACGSTVGVFLLDMVARKGGEAGVRKIAGDRQFERMKRKIGQRGGLWLAIGCLAPPPFPFTMAVATLSGLSYPRRTLLLIVAAARAARFLILAFLALKFGRAILSIINSRAFFWTMVILIAISLVGSALSVAKWLRKGRGARQPAAMPAQA